MSATLADLHLSAPEREHLHVLLAEWTLLADLSFADLVLLGRSPHSSALGAPDSVVIGQVRPSTGSTVHQDDLVGTTVLAGARWVVDRAWTEGRIVRESEPVWTADGSAVREEAIPVRFRGRVIALVLRETSLTAARTPSALEIAYLQAAGDLVQMLSEGTFPAAGSTALATAPRVGDGLLRLDAGGVVGFASPNALSAYRRLGLRGDLTGRRLAEVHGQLPLVGDRMNDDVSAALSVRRVAESELSTEDAVVLLRAVPLLPGGALLGALVLIRDATEVRARDQQLMSKDATIREIHHRVKNNLQTVAALLRLQARRVTVPQAQLALQESVRRVTSIALVHETLSQTLEETVDFDGIADQLVAISTDLARTGSRPRISRKGSFGALPADTATPLALVLSELVQNAVEHGFRGAGGQLMVRVRQRAHGGLEVVVADDGDGLPQGFTLDGSQQLGLQIVRTLVVGELRGTLALRPGPSGGTEAVVALPAAAQNPGPAPEKELTGKGSSRAGQRW